MSIQAMSWALNQDVRPAAAKLLLIVIANYADDRNVAWPSKNRLATDCCMDKSSICRHLEALQVMGLLTITERTHEGVNISSLLTLNTDATGSRTSATGGGTDATGGSRTDATRVVAPVRHKPSLEPLKKEEENPLPPKGGASPLDALRAFEAYNATALRCGLPQAAKLTPDRSRKIIARLKDYGLDGWAQALANIEKSSFLTGTNDRGWRASLEFLLQPPSFSKVHDGGYGNGRHAPKPKIQSRPLDPRRFEDPDYLEKVAREMGVA
jgi:hypothetical protein